ncbi:MAG: DUF2213 domain-containing protein [Holosporaceae bacterium]|nr:DUF2213 domain-containing protein [Holosporaceae bacterium]
MDAKKSFLVYGLEEKNYHVRDDGQLIIKGVVFQEGVYYFHQYDGIFYSKTEFVADEEPNRVGVFHPLSSFVGKTQIKTLQESPIVEFHRYINTDTMGDIVGHVIGEPTVEDGKIIVEMAISNANTIGKILKKELTEISIAIFANFVDEEGKYKNVDYSKSVSGNITYNHIALLPPGWGRMEGNAKILFSKKEKEMTQKNETKDEIENDKNKLMFSKEQVEELKKKMLDEVQEEFKKTLSYSKEIETQLGGNWAQFACDKEVLSKKFFDIFGVHEEDDKLAASIKVMKEAKKLFSKVSVNVNELKKMTNYDDIPKDKIENYQNKKIENVKHLFQNKGV